MTDLPDDPGLADVISGVRQGVITPAGAVDLLLPLRPARPARAGTVVKQQRAALEAERARLLEVLEAVAAAGLALSREPELQSQLQAAEAAAAAAREEANAAGLDNARLGSIIKEKEDITQRILQRAGITVFDQISSATGHPLSVPRYERGAIKADIGPIEVVMSLGLHGVTLQLNSPRRTDIFLLDHREPLADTDCRGLAAMYQADDARSREDARLRGFLGITPGSILDGIEGPDMERLLDILAHRTPTTGRG
jgi:hypothetical protein